MPLKGVTPEKVNRTKPKMVLYGAAGVGKTWFSLDFPKVYYMDTEGGATREQYVEKLRASGGTYFGLEQGSASLTEVRDQIIALATERHDYRTVVWDSHTKSFDNAIADEAKRLADAKIKNEYSADKKPAVGIMRQIVSWLNRLDMNVVVICHKKDEYGLGPSGERQIIGTTFMGYDKLSYDLDLTVELLPKSARERVGRIKKSRMLGFDDGKVYPFNFDDFANVYGRDLIFGEVKAIELATPEQLTVLADLLTRVKVPDDWESKQLAAYGAENWSEVETSKIAKQIESIHKKLKG